MIIKLTREHEDLIESFIQKPVCTIMDWNTIMPIVEKIEQGNYGFKMCRKVVEVYYDDTKEIILKVKKTSRLESLVYAVIDFIKLYPALRSKL